MHDFQINERNVKFAPLVETSLPHSEQRPKFKPELSLPSTAFASQIDVIHKIF